MAGELFVQQVEASGARFSQSMTQLAKDYHKVGKFTPDHVAKILDARLLLRKDLSSIYPIASFFRADMLDMSASNTATARLSTEIDSLKKLPPEAAKTISNLARNAAKRSLAAPSYIDEAPIVTDFRLAKKLKTVGNIVQVVEFLPPAAVLLTTDDNRERERALNELWAKGSGFAVEQMLVRFGPALCVAFGVSTAGWGFAACGIASVAAGIYFGKAVEVNMTKVFGPP
ncbi:hypothetical protein [Methylorubrum aminovorans]